MDSEKRAQMLEEILACILTDLITLRDFKETNVETYNIYPQNYPDKDEWNRLCAANEAELLILERTVEILQSYDGSAPSYIKNIFEILRFESLEIMIGKKLHKEHSFTNIPVNGSK